MEPILHIWGLFRTRGGAHPVGVLHMGLFRTRGGAHPAYGVSIGLGVEPILHMGFLQD